MWATIFGNGTDVVGWTSSPNTRGTWDILTSCVLTLVLCVWSAIHLNIPSRNKKWHQLKLRLGFMLMALLCPEFVALIAWIQLSIARKISSEVNSAFAIEQPPRFRPRCKKWLLGLLLKRRVLEPCSTTKAMENGEREGSVDQYVSDRYPWTLAHGFYLVMGGYTAYVPKLPPEKQYHPTQQAQTNFLTPSGVRLLLRDPDLRERIPNLSKSDIATLGRADALGKSLVCVQAAWFCFQFFTRLAKAMPVSLLELNTFVHCMCALIIYLIWWDKPYDICKTTPIPMEETWSSVAAVMAMANSESGEQEILQQAIRSRDYAITPVTGDLRPRDDSGQLLDGISLQHGETLSGTNFKHHKLLHELPQNSGRVEGTFPGSTDHPQTPCQEPLRLDSATVVRWRLAWQALHLFQEESYSYNAWSSRAENIMNKEQTSAVVFIVCVVAGVAYGGMHGLAWNAYFRTASEKILWRVSCIFAAAAYPIHLAWCYVEDYVDETTHYTVLVAYFVLTVLARAYLVVDSFIRLSYMPAGVYEIPQWTRWVPHFS